jgi:hypothetical protein
MLDAPAEFPDLWLFDFDRTLALLEPVVDWAGSRRALEIELRTTALPAALLDELITAIPRGNLTLYEALRGRLLDPPAAPVSPAVNTAEGGGGGARGPPRGGGPGHWSCCARSARAAAPAWSSPPIHRGPSRDGSRYITRPTSSPRSSAATADSRSSRRPRWWRGRCSSTRIGERSSSAIAKPMCAPLTPRASGSSE